MHSHNYCNYLFKELYFTVFCSKIWRRLIIRGSFLIFLDIDTGIQDVNYANQNFTAYSSPRGCSVDNVSSLVARSSSCADTVKRTDIYGNYRI